MVWERSGDVMMRAYDASGTAHGDELVANSALPYTQRDPDIAALPGGGYVVVWEDDNTSGSGMVIRGRVFAEDGAAQGEQLTLSEPGAIDPAVDTDASGRAIVVWSQGQSVEGRLVYADTQALGPVFTASELTTDVSQPAVAAGGSDEFAVTWQHVGGINHVLVRHFDIVGE